MIEGHRADRVIFDEHLVELDEAHRLPRMEEELAKRFVVLDGMPPVLRMPPRIQQYLTSGYSQVIQDWVREVAIAEAFKGTVTRYAWRDQHPASWDKDRLRTAARDSVIRYCAHHKLTFKFTHDQWGERWTWSNDQNRWMPSGVYGWSSEADITGRAVT